MAKAEKDIDYILQEMKKIKEDRNQVDLQSTIKVSGHSTSEEKTKAKENLEKFSKEKLTKELKNLLEKLTTADDLVYDTIKDYSQFISDDITNASEIHKELYLTQDKVKYLIQAVEETKSVFDAYVKSSGIGYGSEFLQIEQSLEKAKELFKKAQNKTKEAKMQR
ncbi:hypothetical protein [Borrelia persica]|uniref:hypothetical protein n=1 Tax=Borrelia persica TaxID=44448 RepID=UPI0004AE2782|nr:hypothetical protein [Borrelia persica]